MQGGNASDASPGTVLVAFCGLSPAVIPETVWALAHETPPVLPERVVALTTLRGREAIRSTLFASGAWERLRRALDAPPSRLRFGDSAECLRLFPSSDAARDLEDIATGQDSAAAGDFILETLRQFTENPDLRVVLSIAGGRKTMAALGALAMTLLGRPGDRLCHVLVPPPFDDPRLEPLFLFPDPGIAGYTLPGAGPVPAAAARVTLCDIPFVRVRTLFAERLGCPPGTFSRLVERANQSLGAAVPAPRLELDPRTNACRLNGRSCRLATSEFLLLWLLAERARQGCPLVQGCQELSKALMEFHARIPDASFPEKLHWDSGPIERNDFVLRLVSRLKSALRRLLGADPGWPLIDPAPERGHYGLRLPPAAVDIAAPSPPAHAAPLPPRMSADIRAQASPRSRAYGTGIDEREPGKGNSRDG